ncbi:small protein A tmRNA-binding [endosymbiont of Sipalinus gigas]|uniref:outer membrane protein assembly factor BamE domain-containing protein n=1 Tax=endosymbiont of Sipalinus gigas TaxID=1972134 RepID=UPI000DC700F7|nr:outer membrane protein assembly factor BamE [endosymbiont of Sipalinus gigas]BBA85198.1 small protein A tmRNA-binding [endosymbiont of Sipalinus gigas]
MNYFLIFFLVINIFNISNCNNLIVNKSSNEKLINRCSYYGVYIDDYHANSLNIGDDKKKVIEKIGSPILISPFDENIWIYLYYKITFFGNIKIIKKIKLIFFNDVLVKIYIKDDKK